MTVHLSSVIWAWAKLDIVSPRHILYKGLPNGPYGLLGAAEGVSSLAILAGLAVLYFQVMRPLATSLTDNP